MRHLFVAAAILFGTVLVTGRSAFAQNTVPAPLFALRMQLSAIANRAPGFVALEVKDLTTGYISEVNADASMPAASTIKIPVMVEVFRQLKLGTFDLNTAVTLRASDRDWGSGWMASHVGAEFPVSRLLLSMVTVSDNTATNALIRLVGRSHVNATMRELGLSHTKLSDYIRSSGPIRSALRSSPADMVSLLERMARASLIDQWSSRQMIQILSGQRHNTLLPQPLPDDVAIAHKTGMLHDTLNDVGVVYAQPAPYVIAVMTTNLSTLSAGRRFIRSVSRMSYEGLQRFADWRDRNAPEIGPPDLVFPGATLFEGSPGVATGDE